LDRCAARATDVGHNLHGSGIDEPRHLLCDGGSHARHSLGKGAAFGGILREILKQRGAECGDGLASSALDRIGKSRPWKPMSRRG